MLTKLSSKKCSVLFLIVCIIFSLLFAYSFALKYGVSTEYFAVTKNIDAPEVLPMDTVNIPLFFTLGSVVFILFAVLSVLASELFYCVLEFLRQRIRKED